MCHRQCVYTPHITGVSSTDKYTLSAKLCTSKNTSLSVWALSLSVSLYPCPPRNSGHIPAEHYANLCQDNRCITSWQFQAACPASVLLHLQLKPVFNQSCKRKDNKSYYKGIVFTSQMHGEKYFPGPFLRPLKVSIPAFLPNTRSILRNG